MLLKASLSVILIIAISSSNASSEKSNDVTKIHKFKKPHLKSTPITYIMTNAANNKVEHRTDDYNKYHLDKSSGKVHSSKKTDWMNNHELLSKLGLEKMLMQNSHKKRLAVESRHHGRPDDSHMVIIKLPPNSYYYSNDNPKSLNNFGNHIMKPQIGFKMNGKPEHIYHANLPVLKKMLENSKSRHGSARRSDTDEEKMWSRLNENDTVGKSYNKIGYMGKVLKKKSPSYYAPPAPPQPKQSGVGKYFPGNGKPQRFYVIEKNSKRQVHHKIIP